MLRYLLLFFVLSCQAQAVLAQSSDKVLFKGLVIDSAGTVVSDAHVFTSSRGTTTDQAGEFEIWVAEGEWVSISHVNFEPESFVYLQRDNAKLSKVLLKPLTRMLNEVRVSDILSEQQLKEKVMQTDAVSTEQRMVNENSEMINHLGRIAPPPEQTLQEQYFESLKGPKDFTIFSSKAGAGLGGLIRSLRNNDKRKGYSTPTYYKSNPFRVTPFRIRAAPDTLKSDSTVVKEP